MVDSEWLYPGKPGDLGPNDPRIPPDPGLGPQVRNIEDTFSAFSVFRDGFDREARSDFFSTVKIRVWPRLGGVEAMSKSLRHFRYSGPSVSWPEDVCLALQEYIQERTPDWQVTVRIAEMIEAVLNARGGPRNDPYARTYVVHFVRRDNNHA